MCDDGILSPPAPLSSSRQARMPSSKGMRLEAARPLWSRLGTVIMLHLSYLPDQSRDQIQGTGKLNPWLNGKHCKVWCYFCNLPQRYIAFVSSWRFLPWRWDRVGRSSVKAERISLWFWQTLATLPLVPPPPLKNYVLLLHLYKDKYEGYILQWNCTKNYDGS